MTQCTVRLDEPAFNQPMDFDDGGTSSSPVRPIAFPNFDFRFSALPFFYSHLQFWPLCSGPYSNRRSKLKINERHWAGRRKQFERKECQHVCRDLNACRLQREAIDELAAFLRDGQE